MKRENIRRLVTDLDLVTRKTSVIHVLFKNQVYEQRDSAVADYIMTHPGKILRKVRGF